MTPARFNTFCKSLPHATYVCQWGGSHVWKIGGKVFAIGSTEAGDQFHVTFKCSPLAFEVLKEQPGCRPAPYLASRGMIWIQRTGPGALDDDGLKEHLRESYRLAGLNLTKARRRELGLDASTEGVQKAPGRKPSAAETGTPGSGRKPSRARRA